MQAGSRPDPLTLPPQLARGSEPRATILIVEDHADSRDAIGLLVTSLGYRAILAGTGAQALTLLQESRPDLILCDVRMPGMDGFAFVRALRSQPGVNGVKLVAVTGLSDRADVTRLLQAGFDGYLVKPLDFGALLETLDRLLWMPPKR
jgi:CheY-like chemotaxis protein